MGANKNIFGMFVPEMGGESVISIHQAVLRARTLRASYFNSSPGQRAILEARALVQNFVSTAADGATLVLPAASAAARAAAHSEAERFGIRHERAEVPATDASTAPAPSVRLINLPLTAAVVADAPVEPTVPEA